MIKLHYYGRNVCTVCQRLLQATYYSAPYWMGGCGPRNGTQGFRNLGKCSPTEPHPIRDSTPFKNYLMMCL